MVMYEDDNNGSLYLRYEDPPSASKIVKDLVDAPIERGESFYKKKKLKKKKETIDKYIIIDYKLSNEMEKSVVHDIDVLKPDWKPTKSKGLLGFELLEEEKPGQNDYL